MLKSITTIIIFILITFFIERLDGQDSVFVADRYKWELGIRLDASSDDSNPFSILLKKHISARTTWRFGLGFNYNKIFENDLPVLEDYNLSRIFIFYEIDRREKKLDLSISTGLQRNFSVKSLNLFTAFDLVLKYNMDNIELPNGIKYFDVRIPEGSFITAKQNNKNDYGFALRPSLGVQYPFSKRLSITLETSLYYRIMYNISKDFYYFVDSDNSGVISYGTVDAIPDKNWNYQMNAGLFHLITFSYHFN